MDSSSSSTAYGLPTSHLLGSVPAVINDEKKATTYDAPEAKLQIFPPNNSRDKGPNYQTLGIPDEGDGGQQPTNNWKGVFNIASYTQYFNVDTDVVVNRLISSLHPVDGDFFNKIDANPDLYGLIWISTTLVFLIASLGNLATYLTYKQSDNSDAWTFDVGYVSLAASTVYGYAIVVPVAFYFLLQYLGSNASLVRFWCMWGYSLFLLVLSSFLLVVPVEFLRWLIIVLTGAASACFVALNLRSYMAGSDLTVLVIASFVLQLALAIFIKVKFFP